MWPRRLLQPVLGVPMFWTAVIALLPLVIQWLVHLCIGRPATNALPPGLGPQHEWRAEVVSAWSYTCGGPTAFSYSGMIQFACQQAWLMNDGLACVLRFICLALVAIGFALYAVVTMKQRTVVSLETPPRGVLAWLGTTFIVLALAVAAFTQYWPRTACSPAPLPATQRAVPVSCTPISVPANGIRLTCSSGWLVSSMTGSRAAHAT